MIKTCRKCTTEKPTSEFYAHAGCKDGLSNYCKVCLREYGNRRYSNMSKDEKKLLVQRHREWLAKNPKKRNQLKRKNWTPEKLERMRRLARESYYKNRKERIARQAKYNSRPEVRVRMNLRRRVGDLICKTRKSAKTYSLIGCSPAFLVNWLEARFQDGMTWENYGKWHIDHIIPCSSFDLSKEEQQRQCFHYSNLRPLWAQENISKGDKIIPNTQPELAIPLAQ